MIHSMAYMNGIQMMHLQMHLHINGVSYNLNISIENVLLRLSFTYV